MHLRFEASRADTEITSDTRTRRRRAGELVRPLWDWEATVVSRGQQAGCVGNAEATRVRVEPESAHSFSMAVSCGTFSTLVVTEAGRVLASGWGEYGQLGLVDTQHRRHMTRPAGDFTARMVMVSAGMGHSALLDSDGELWMSGLGYAGQLGTGGRDDMLTPTRVPKSRFGGTRVKMAACGASHTLVLTKVGRVWAFGCGLFGRLGTGDEEVRTTPTEVVGLRGVTITFLAAGESHSELEPREVEAGRFGGDRVVQAAAGAALTAAVRMHSEGLTGDLEWKSLQDRRTRRGLGMLLHWVPSVKRQSTLSTLPSSSRFT